MIHAPLLFVYLLAYLNEHVQGKCIACSAEDPEGWPSCVWEGAVLPAGPIVRLSQVVTDTVERGCEPGYESLYAAEPFVANAEVEIKPRLLSIQNFTFIHLQSAEPLPDTPFFISFAGLTTPLQRSVTVKFKVHDITEVPDVAFYIERYETPHNWMDKWDRMMIPAPELIPRTPLPAGCYLPVTFRSGEKEIAGTYRIVRQLSDSLAECEVFLSDNNFEPTPGCLLVRSAKSLDGEMRSCDLGTIVDDSHSPA